MRVSISGVLIIVAAAVLVSPAVQAKVSGDLRRVVIRDVKAGCIKALKQYSQYRDRRSRICDCFARDFADRANGGLVLSYEMANLSEKKSLDPKMDRLMERSLKICGL